MFALTLPEKVAAYMSKLYATRSVILEYGPGGSTVLALEANDQNMVFACETDSTWPNRLCMEVSLRGLGGRFYPDSDRRSFPGGMFPGVLGQHLKTNDICI
jgi:hypothetical protein